MLSCGYDHAQTADLYRRSAGLSALAVEAEGGDAASTLKQRLAEISELLVTAPDSELDALVAEFETIRRRLNRE